MLDLHVATAVVLGRLSPEASGVSQQVVAAASSINQNVCACTTGVIKFKIQMEPRG